LRPPLYSQKERGIQGVRYEVRNGKIQEIRRI
jgi:hypothetical protein